MSRPSLDVLSATCYKVLSMSQARLQTTAFHIRLGGPQWRASFYCWRFS
jgi:hypothetical protein